MACKCEICNYITAFRKHIATIDNQEAREFFEAAVNRMLDCEADLDYYDAVFSGDWPEAEGVLETALNKIREKNNVRPKAQI